jgi:hypothetical protein
VNTSEEFASRYEYSPIGYRKIRLVELRREECLEAPDNQVKISVSFLEVALDSPPEYEALSYVWGGVYPDGPPRRSVRYGDRAEFLSITANLDIALKHFCPKTRESKRLMWIDALCINQDSIDEKNAQLLLMPEIYKTAQSVLVWLGPEENDSDLAYFFLNVFFRTEERKYKYLDGCRAVADEAVRHTAAWRAEQSGSTVTTREFSFTPWRALADLLRRPWFRRVWVIQEVLMGRNVLMICGEHKASWEDFSYVAQQINSPGIWPQLTAAEVQDDEGARPLGVFMIRMMEDWRKNLQAGHVQNLESSILLTIESEATDPRDMIWALRGVTEPDDHPSLIPNYNRSVAEVFTSTARHLICDGSDLDLLCIAACQKRTLDSVSSWVPIFGGAYERFIFALCRPPFYATGSTTAVVNSSDADPNILSVKGTVVDTVKTITTARPTLRDATSETLKALHEPSSNRAWVSEALSLVADRDIYVTGEPMFDAFWRTLIAHSDSRPVPPVFKVYYSLWLQSLNLDRDLHGKTLDQIARARPMDPQVSQSASRAFADRFYRFSAGRRFGITENGYIGLLPAETEAGDTVVVLDGARVPFVLRQTIRGLEPRPLGEVIVRDEFTVIGDCYVHGIMLGEFMGHGTEARDFALR